MIRFELEARRGAFTLEAAWQSDARVAGLHGATGSGKTTLLLCLAGLVRPARGIIECDGQVLYDGARGVCLPPEARGLGVVFQESRLFPHLPVAGNLRFSPAAPDRPGASFDEVVHLLDLEPLLDREISGLSGGERRLVALGRALLARPRLLLLDEPLTGLDPTLRRRVLAYLLRLKQRLDVHVLLVSHVLSDFLALADAMALMEGGRITASGRPEEMFDRVLRESGGEEGRGGDPLETALPGRVLATEGDLARVEVTGAVFEVVLAGARVGDDVLLGLGAREVLVGVGMPPRTSARNVLPGRIASLHRGSGSVFLSIDAGPRFWAEVTEGAVRELGLAPGVPVYALIKAAALRGAVLPRPTTLG